MKKVLWVILAVLLVGAGFATAGVIHDAVQNGEYGTVKQLIKVQPQLLEDRDEAGCTPLHIAARIGNKKIAKLLVKKGAEIDAGDNELSTPLHAAAIEGQLDLVKYLVSKDADIHFQDEGGMSALQWASYNGQVEVAKYLVKKGADIEIAKPVNLSRSLHGAANRGHMEMTMWLVEQGAEIDPPNAAGFTPLLSAASAGEFEAVKYLVEQGADLFAKNQWNGDALYFAAESDNPEFVEYLLEQGFPLQSDDPDWRNPLMTAAIGGKVEIAEVLIKHGSDVNWAMDDGRTPLHWAAHRGHADIAELLIKHGANVNNVSTDGVSPLHLGANLGFADFSEALLKNGANANLAEGHWGQTALHRAAARGYTDVTKKLMKAGADLNIEDLQGRTPLYLAKTHCNEGAAKVLSKHGGTTGNLEKGECICKHITNPLEEGQAVFSYLGHCGFGVKTKNHYMVFDYWASRWREADNPCLANGHINCEECADLNMEVFVTHDHGDHYDSTIFTWKDKIEDLTYIFGFQPENLPPYAPQYYSGQEYTYTAPRTQTDLDGMKITTVESNDGGVGFLVQADGVAIWFAGDHAGYDSEVEGSREEFTREIDYLADVVGQVDVALVNITGCRHSGKTEELYEGNRYTVEKLSPKVLIPTHGINSEYKYQEYAEQIAAENLGVEVYAPQNKGDFFVYRKDGQVEISAR